MFELSQVELEKMGASITTREIKQEPELWEETLQIYQQHQTEIVSFLDNVKDQAQQKRRVIFTSAGTSQYVDDNIVSYLRKYGNTAAYLFESIGTTDIVSAPEETLLFDEPTILVLFARSGNSPESVAAINLVEKNVKNIYHLIITGAKSGALAVSGKKAANTLILLMSEFSNDGGFTMTGSFSCMTLAALLIFDQIALKVMTIGQIGQHNFSDDKFEFTKSSKLLPDGYLALADIMSAQTLALLTAIKINNTPDIPSPGTVNRVVKGVKVHDFK